MKNKNLIILGLISIVLVIGIAAFLWQRSANKDIQEEMVEPTTQRRRVVEELNVIATDKRPAISIFPHADGRNVSINVLNLNKEAQSAEYELEYQAGTLLQGAFGMIELDNLPAKTTILLGSCSAGGACTYHQDVKGGTLLTRFDGPEKYALKSDWKYIDNINKESQMSSKDAKFQLSGVALNKTRYAVIFNSPGLPQQLDEQLASEIYSLSSSSSITGPVEITMRANNEGDLAIKMWSQNQWLELSSTTEGKQVSATTDKLGEFFVVIEK